MNTIINKDKLKTVAWCLMLAYTMFLVPSDVMAQQVIGDLLCSVVEWFNGPVGAGIATLAIIMVGIGALMGKVSWGVAIIVGIGVAVIFGAGNIVQELAPSGDSC